MQSSGIGTYDVSWAARSEEPNGKTSPEELIAAAHSSCFSMALSGQLGNANLKADSIRTTATVTLDKTEAGFTVTRVMVERIARADGLPLERVRAEMEADRDPDAKRPGPPVFDKNVRALAENADILIYDAQYLPEEYQAQKRGWGHSHWREAVNIAMGSGAKELVLFHHDPDHTDNMIDKIVTDARNYYPKVRAASEGMEIQL